MIRFLFFLQISTQNFEKRRRVPRVKKTDEIKKEHTHKHTHTHTHTHTRARLSLYLSIRWCNVYFDMPAPVSLSLSLHLQTRFGSRSDPNGIQDRMFRQFKNVCIIRLCLINAYVHDKFGFWVLIGSSCNKIDWLTQTLCFDIPRNQAKTKDSCANTVQSLSLLLRPAIKVCKHFGSRRSSDVPDQGQTSIPRVII